jgi:hypothetical protein
VELQTNQEVGAIHIPLLRLARKLLRQSIQPPKGTAGYAAVNFPQTV